MNLSSPASICYCAAATVAPTDWEGINAMEDEDIDLSDIPEEGLRQIWRKELARLSVKEGGRASRKLPVEKLTIHPVGRL